MNIPLIAADPSLADQHASALTRANAWRGQMLHIFAKAEAAVTEALAGMAALPERGIGVRLPHLVGQRFEALADAMNSGGNFAGEGVAIRPLAMRMKDDLPLRAALAHGVGRVTIDRAGRWTMILRTTGLKAGQLTSDISVVEERDAETVRDDLQRTMQQLCDRIAKLTATLRQ
ncbi:hypothetical protein [Sphingomonas sp. VNH70]|uniref:hypothetical protein n=1 Tax=Sphingomonas silueang TaxID=3156617 RepID=UPI0032B3D168